MMASFFERGSAAPIERLEFPFAALCDELQISRQTFLLWVDRRLIDGSVRWALTEDNEEYRVVAIRKDRYAEIKAFAREYRQDYVTSKEAQHMLKVVNTKQVKRLLRDDSIQSAVIDAETKLLVGSIEDYLIGLEQEWDEAHTPA